MGPAHAQYEQRHRQRDADKYRRHDIDGDREDRNDDRDTKVEAEGAPARAGRPEQPHRGVLAPGIDVLDRHHHDERGEHRTRQIGHHGKQHHDGDELQCRVDRDRDPGGAAEAAIGHGGADIDAGGDATGRRRRGVGKAESHQQVIAVAQPFAGLAGELGAQHGVDRRD